MYDLFLEYGMNLCNSLSMIVCDRMPIIGLSDEFGISAVLNCISAKPIVMLKQPIMQKLNFPASFCSCCLNIANMIYFPGLVVFPAVPTKTGHKLHNLNHNFKPTAGHRIVCASFRS